MNSQIKEKYLKAKNKPMYIAKMFMHKKATVNKVWNLSECIRITKCIEKYVNGDELTLNRIFEYLNSIDKIEPNTSIYKLLRMANDSAVDRKFNQSESKPRFSVNLMKYL